MKRFLAVFIGVILAEIIALTAYAFSVPDLKQDAVKVNEVLKSVESNWDNFGNLAVEGVDFVITDNDGDVLYKTKAILCLI